MRVSQNTCKTSPGRRLQERRACAPERARVAAPKAAPGPSRAGLFYFFCWRAVVFHARLSCASCSATRHSSQAFAVLGCRAPALGCRVGRRKELLSAQPCRL